MIRKLLIALALVALLPLSAWSALTFGAAPHEGGLIRDNTQARQFAAALEERLGETVSVRLFRDEGTLHAWLNRYQLVDIAVFSRAYVKRQPAGEFLLLSGTGAFGSLNPIVLRQGSNRRLILRLQETITRLAADPEARRIFQPAPVAPPQPKVAATKTKRAVKAAPPRKAKAVKAKATPRPTTTQTRMAAKTAPEPATAAPTQKPTAVATATEPTPDPAAATSMPPAPVPESPATTPIATKRAEKEPEPAAASATDTDPESAQTPKPAATHAHTAPSLFGLKSLLLILVAAFATTGLGLLLFQQRRRPAPQLPHDAGKTPLAPVTAANGSIITAARVKDQLYGERALPSASTVKEGGACAADLAPGSRETESLPAVPPQAQGETDLPNLAARIVEASAEPTPPFIPADPIPAVLEPETKAFPADSDEALIEPEASLREEEETGLGTDEPVRAKEEVGASTDDLPGSPWETDEAEGLPSVSPEAFAEAPGAEESPWPKKTEMPETGNSDVNKTESFIAPAETVGAKTKVEDATEVAAKPFPWDSVEPAPKETQEMMAETGEPFAESAAPFSPAEDSTTAEIPLPVVQPGNPWGEHISAEVESPSPFSEKTTDAVETTPNALPDGFISADLSDESAGELAELPMFHDIPQADDFRTKPQEGEIPIAASPGYLNFFQSEEPATPAATLPPSGNSRPEAASRRSSAASRSSLSISGELGGTQAPALLKLISGQRKPGRLRVLTKIDEKHIHFNRGHIAAVHAFHPTDGSPTAFLMNKLGALLLRRELISQAQLERAMEICSLQPNRRIGEILMETSPLTEGDLRDTLHIQAEELLFSWLFTPHGYFEYEAMNLKTAVNR